MIRKTRKQSGISLQFLETWSCRWLEFRSPSLVWFVKQEGTQPLQSLVCWLESDVAQLDNPCQERNKVLHIHCSPDKWSKGDIFSRVQLPALTSKDVFYLGFSKPLVLSPMAFSWRIWQLMAWADEPFTWVQIRLHGWRQRVVVNGVNCSQQTVTNGVRTGHSPV